jgi:1-aminocyclopropane-1-carboxylate deaminase/D-cysteine desulfhydrase-like pyridoxal-dependent ACC family enzyme
MDNLERSTSRAAAPPASLPLFDRFPALRDRFHRIPLGRYPTPVERQEIETEAGAVPLLVKRDDLCGREYGGNKVRKLEFLLAAARARGAERVITAGATGSHHALATAVYGRQLGFAVTLVLFPQKRTQHVRDVLLMDHALGAELRFARRMESVPFALLTARLAHRRQLTYVIPPGGSDAIGTLGYVSAGLELAAQIADGSAARPAAIHVAAGTLGTAAGLALGLAAAELDIPVVATRITARMVTNIGMLRRLLTRTHALLQRHGADMPPVAAALERITLTHDQFGDGYGRPTPAGAVATERFAAVGLTLDTTYTAKAAAGLLAAAANGAGDGAPLMFWHTLSSVAPHQLIDAELVDTLPAKFADYLRR